MASTGPIRLHQLERLGIPRACRDTSAHRRPDVVTRAESGWLSIHVLPMLVEEVHAA